MLPHATVTRPQGQAGFKEGLHEKGQFATQDQIFSGYLASCQSKWKAYEAAISWSLIQGLSWTYSSIKEKMSKSFQMQLLPDDFLAVCTEQKIPVVFRL